MGNQSYRDNRPGEDLRRSVYDEQDRTSQRRSQHREETQYYYREYGYEPQKTYSQRGTYQQPAGTRQTDRAGRSYASDGGGSGEQRREEYRVRVARAKKKRMQELRRKRRILLGFGALLILGAALAVVLTLHHSAKSEKEIADIAEQSQNASSQETLSYMDSIPEDAQPVVSTQQADAEPTVDPETEYTVTDDNAVQIVSENVQSEYAVLIDVDTMSVIAGKNYDTRISPASMTKILTVLTAVDELRAQAAEQGTDLETILDDTVEITVDITDYAYKNEGSIVGFDVGEQPTVRDLFYGTILPSGADAAAALAVYVSGSQEAFVEKMNAELEKLGLSDTAHFTNCVGLYDADHYCTLIDMAMILKAALQDDLCLTVLSTHVYTTSQTEQHPDGIEISNWFLRRIEDKDCHGVVEAAKTGFVNESGSCAASFQVSDSGGHHICVTANAWSAWRCIYDQVEIYDLYTN